MWSCRKDVEEFHPYTPVEEFLNLFLAQAPGASSFTAFPFGGPVPDTTLTTASGVRVFLADTENLLADEAGTPVPCSTCPSLKIEVTSVLNKGDLLARELPTIASTNGQMLESAGAVYVKASCNGKILHLLPNRYLKIQFPAQGVKADMELFTGVTGSQNEFLGWHATGTKAFWAEWPAPGTGAIQSGYELIAPQLGWINCARPINEQSASFCVTLPSQFNALNTRVFLVFQNIRAVAELKGSGSTPEFCYSNIPIGFPVQIVMVGKTGGQYWLARQFTETGNNVKLPLTPEPTPDQDILDFLKSL